MRNKCKCKFNNCHFCEDGACSALYAPALDKDGKCKFFKTTRQLGIEYNKNAKRLKRKGYI